MKRLSTEEIKEVIAYTFDRPFNEIISRKFAENNYAKYLFISYLKNKGMSYGSIARHIPISRAAIARYMKDYIPDVYVQELFETRFYAEVMRRLKSSNEQHIRQ